ncbi:MAG: hypothetical protein ACLGHL_09365 [Actinomycetota bacterium]
MRRTPIFLLVLSLLAAACSSSDTDGSSADGSTQQAADFTSWEEDGVSLEHPEGWNVAIDSANGTVSIEGSESERLYIRPFFVPTRLSDEAAGAALQEVAPMLLEATWATAEGSEPAVRMSGDADGGDAVAALTWTASESGSSGFVAVAFSPDYPRSQGTFTRILESFALSGTTDAGAEPSYQTFMDPTEGAFGAEVPSGWNVE